MKSITNITTCKENSGHADITYNRNAPERYAKWID